MIRLLILYFTLCFISFFFSKILNIGFGKAICISYIVTAFIMLFSSIIGKLSYFKYFLLILIVLFFFILIRKYNYKVYCELFSPSFVLFTIFFFYLYFVMKTKGLSQVDDFARWSGKVQEALRFDCLYTIDGYSYMKADYYPPFSTLNEIFFNKMLGGYNDSSSLFANGSLCFALVMCFVDRFKWTKKDIFNIICSFFITIFILLSVNKNPTLYSNAFVFNSTYPDWLTGLMLGLGFITILEFKGDISDFLFFCFLNTALLHIDRTSFAFSILLTITLAYKLFFNKTANKKDILKYLVFCILIPVSIYMIWRLYLSKFDSRLLYYITNVKQDTVEQQKQILKASVSLNAFSIKEILILKPYQMDILKEFIRRFFVEPIYIHPFNISYFSFNVAVCLLMLLIRTFKKAKEISIITVFYFLGSLAYAAAVCYTYMYHFPRSEAIGLDVYGRYLQVYTISGLVILSFVINKYIKHSVSYPSVLLLLLLFVEPLSVETIIPTPNKLKYKQNEIVAIKKYVDYEYNYESTVVVDSYEIAYYYLIRNTYGEKASNIVIFNNHNDAKLEDFIELCQKNDYLLIGDTDEDFVNNYWKTISEQPCYNSTLYRIVKNDNNVDFEIVYVFGTNN